MGGAGRPVWYLVDFCRLISPGGLLTPQVCRCLCGGASILDVAAPFEPRLPGVLMDMNATPEDDDQEANAPTTDEQFIPDWG